VTFSTEKRPFSNEAYEHVLERELIGRTSSFRLSRDWKVSSRCSSSRQPAFSSLVFLGAGFFAAGFALAAGLAVTAFFVAVASAVA
jgi:hypothetical protein